MDGVSYAVLGEAAGISGLGVDIPTFATVPYGGIKAAAVVGSMPIRNPATQANGCPLRTVPGRHILPRCGSDLPPEILESVRRQFGVPDGVLNVLVPQVGLQRPGILAVVRELVAARFYLLKACGPAGTTIVPATSLSPDPQFLDNRQRQRYLARHYRLRPREMLTIDGTIPADFPTLPPIHLADLPTWPRRGVSSHHKLKPESKLLFHREASAAVALSFAGRRLRLYSSHRRDDRV